MFILLFLIFIHELGHLLFAYLIGYRKVKIILYPFGGVTKYNELLNSSMTKELIVLMGGPIFQELIFLLLILLYKNSFITDINFNIASSLHKTLFYFNFLPIIPLDGSKLLSLFLEKFFSYKKSNIILIIISILSIFILVIFEKRFIIIFLSAILIKSIMNEINIHKLKFNKFILERYLYNFKFKEGKLIKNIKKIKRSKKHKIIENNQIISEEEYLKSIYK